MDVKRLFDFVVEQQIEHPMEKCIGRKDGDGWMFYSTSELLDRAYKLAGGLLDLGIEPGDRVTMVAYTNRPEWVVVDLATQMIGGIPVPLYPTISSNEYKYILNDAAVKAVFVGADDLYDKVAEAQKEVPSLKHIYTFDKQDNRPFWEEIYNDSHRDKIDALSANVDENDLSTIIYTSGTTGNPKGVMLTHRNIIKVIEASFEHLPVPTDKPVLSFLPFCHIFEKAMLYGYIKGRSQIHCTGTTNLGGPDGDLAQVKPYFFSTVPRLLEKVYEKIFNKGLELTGIKRKLFLWSLRLADKYEHQKPFNGIKEKIADKLIFSKWREALGGNVIGIVTGAAACSEKIARVFSAAGIPIMEGYGLTETSPTLTMNRFFNRGAKIGTVGSAISCCELMLDDSDGEYRDGEGEILAIGDNVMIGYYNKPKETAAVFKEINGKLWFRTGDIGKFVSGPNNLKYLKITDRKKELLKTSGGKYVAPSPIENKFKEDFLIEQIMVVGEKQKFVSALIVPAIEPLKEWCKLNGVTWTSLEEVIKDQKVIDRYSECCDHFNPEFSHIEQIKKFALIPNTWEAVRVDGTESELTPTMKLKRRVIREKYKDAIEHIYDE